MGRENLNRLSLGTIRCVKEVLANGNVTVAAGRLGISQPAVSQQVARFERLSGIPVIARSGNALIMRPDTIAPLMQALAEMERVVDTISQNDSPPRPRLGICQFAVANHCDGKLLQSLLDEFDIHFGSLQILSSMFARGELDAVVRPLSPNEMETDLIAAIPLVWIAARSNPLCERRPADQTVPIILNADPSPYTVQAERALQKAKIDYRVVARVEDQYALSRLILDGLGCTLVPEPLVRHYQDEMSVIEWLPVVDDIGVGLLHNNKILPAAKARKLFSQLFSDHH